MEIAIRGYFGNNVIVVFFPGCAGEVTQVDNQSPLAIKQFGESSSAKLGGAVGAEAVKVLLAMDPHGPLTPVAVASKTQVVQVGPVAFCTSPAEYFCQYGIDVKRASKFPYTFPVSLANGCVGYVPTTEAFSPQGGGYETRLSSYSNLEIPAGDTIARSLIELTDSLTPTSPAVPKPLPPFTGEPWTYGRVPPELE